MPCPLEVLSASGSCQRRHLQTLQGASPSLSYRIPLKPFCDGSPPGAGYRGVERVAFPSPLIPHCVTCGSIHTLPTPRTAWSQVSAQTRASDAPTAVSREVGLVSSPPNPDLRLGSSLVWALLG